MDFVSKDVAEEIRRGVFRLARRLRTQRSTNALSLSKLSILSHLNHNGSTTPGDLASIEHQQPQSLTRVFAELEQAGLTSRTRSHLDGRQVVLTITTQGRDALRQDMEGCDAWLTSKLAKLTETERQVLRLAGDLMNRLAEA